MAVPRSTAAPRAYFCPQCGQGVRPYGSQCPACRAGIALPPPLAQRLRSEAEALVPVAMAAVRPDPWVPAPLLTRIGAHTIDLSLVCAFTFPFLVIFNRHLEVVPLLLVGMLCAWQLLFPPLFGGTPGMHMMQLRLVDAADDSKPDPVQAMLRLVGYGFAVLTFGGSMLARFYREDRAGWHDLLAGTRLVAPRATPQ